MFLVCGEALWDLFPTPRATGIGFDARVGGSPFNVAVGLARLGQPAALLTGVSSDRLGNGLVAALEAEGVATRFLIRSRRPSTLSLVDVGDDGSPAYTFYGSEGADRAVEVADLPALGPDTSGLHAGSFSLVVEPVGSSLLTLVQREAGRRLITLDPNVRVNIVPDRGLWRERVDAFARHADLLKVSSEDLDLLYPGAPAEELAARWRAAGTGLVVVTRGAGGAVAYGPQGTTLVPGRRVEVVDTVGAGDCFQAALIARLAERGVAARDRLDALAAEAVADVVGFAVQASAIACTRRGADLPRRGELNGSALSGI